MPIEFEPRRDEGHPNFLQVVRMYRQERELSFEDAKDLAIAEFDKRGWRHPFRKTIYVERIGQ